MTKLRDLFNRFCESSSIHGISYWHTKEPIWVRSLWTLVTLLGISSAAYMIRNNFISWESNPIIVSVWQVPIEESPFPGISICPLDDTRYASIEMVLNDANPNLPQSDLINLTQYLFLSLSKGHELGQRVRDCAMFECEGKASAFNCSNEFQRFYEFIWSSNGDYETFLKDSLFNLSSQIVNREQIKDLRREFNSVVAPQVPTNVEECIELFKLSDFLYETLPRIFGGFRNGDLKLGTYISWILYHSDQLAHKKEILELIYKIINPRSYPALYGRGFGISPEIFIPTLVTSLAGKGESMNNRRPAGEVKYSRELVYLMKQSLSPADVIVKERNEALNPHPGIPYCLFSRSDEEGINLGYETKFCQSMQPVINDEGLCYSFNNEYFDFIPGYESTNVKRNVKGPGIKKGLTLVLDSHNTYLGRNTSKGYKVIVAKRGDAGGKVQYVVKPDFYGETNFFLSGIHFVQTTPGFRNWNEKNKFCYFPDGKNLSHFKVYSQENCLIECKMRAVSSKCGCAPWFFENSSLPLCDSRGMNCFSEGVSNYKNDIPDRISCDCKNDCEMVHFIFSMNLKQFVDRKIREPRFWYNEENGKGFLSDYLLDPKGIFTDNLSQSFSKIKANLTSSREFAQSRFKNDISIMNFYYVTPIITYVFLELKVSIFDQISAIGGQLGLFTGFSLISGFEIIYWGFSVLMEFILRGN